MCWRSIVAAINTAPSSITGASLTAAESATAATREARMSGTSGNHSENLVGDVSVITAPGRAHWAAIRASSISSVPSEKNRWSPTP